MVTLWREGLMVNTEDMYNGFVDLYKKKGFPKFLDVFNDTKLLLSEDESDTIYRSIESMWKADQKILGETVKKQDGGGGGEGGGFGGNVATSSDSGFFTPTYGGDKKKKKKVEKKYETLKKALDQRYMEHDEPKVSEFPSQMDNTAVEAEQEYVMQVEQIKDGEKKDRRSKESSLTENVDLSEEAIRNMKLDKMFDEAYNGSQTNIQKTMRFLD